MATRCAPPLHAKAAWPGQRRAAGLTLVELMTVVSVLAVMVAIAAPSFRQVLIEQRLASATSSLHALLWFARSETIKRNTPVNVEVATGAPWTVYRCLDGSTSCALDAREVLQVAASSASGVRLDARDFRFAPQGRLTSGAGRLEFTDAQGQARRCLNISTSGRSISQSGACP